MKTWKLILSLVVAVCMIVGMAGCGGGDDDDSDSSGSLVGSWTLTDLYITGYILPITADMVGVTATVRADGTLTGTISIPLIGYYRSGDATWSTSGDVFTVLAEGQAYSGRYELSGNTARLSTIEPVTVTGGYQISGTATMTRQ